MRYDMVAHITNALHDIDLALELTREPTGFRWHSTTGVYGVYFPSQPEAVEWLRELHDEPGTQLLLAEKP